MAVQNEVEWSVKKKSILGRRHDGKKNHRNGVWSMHFDIIVEL